MDSRRLRNTPICEGVCVGASRSTISMVRECLADNVKHVEVRFPPTRKHGHARWSWVNLSGDSPEALRVSLVERWHGHGGRHVETSRTNEGCGVRHRNGRGLQTWPGGLPHGGVANHRRGLAKMRQAVTEMAMPISATIGPRRDQVVVLLIGLPDTAPNPCSVKRRPASATSTPATMMTLRMTSTVAVELAWRLLRSTPGIPATSTVQDPQTAVLVEPIRLRPGPLGSRVGTDGIVRK